MKRTLFIIIAALLALTGCTSYGDYYRGIAAANTHQLEVERERAAVEGMRINGLVQVAQSGGETAQAMAVMALAGIGGSGALGQARMAVPERPQNEALQWASVLVPGATQIGLTAINARTSMRANDNATRLGIHTNETFARFASEIAKPPVVVEQPPPVIVPAPDPVIVIPPDPVIVNPIVVPAPSAPVSP